MVQSVSKKNISKFTPSPKKLSICQSDMLSAHLNHKPTQRVNTDITDTSNNVKTDSQPHPLMNYAALTPQMNPLLWLIPLGFSF